MQTYLEENQGFVTQTKLKAFGRCELLYYLSYEKELHEEAESTESQILGTILDDYCSMSEDNFWLKWTLVIPKTKYEAFIEDLDDDVWVERVRIGSQRKDKNAEFMITAWDQVQDSIRELQRQPLYCFNDKYDAQKVLFAEYKGLKLKIKPDRYSLEKMEVRDLKTCKEIISKNGFPSFVQDISNYGYDFQLAFYQIVIEINTGKKFDCIIDAKDKTANNTYECYKLTQMTINEQKHRAIELLEGLIKAKETNTYRPCIDRDQCRSCRMYKYCPKTAIQKTVTEI